MKVNFFRRKKLGTDEENRLESLLASVLIPVTPGITFSDRFKTRLSEEPEIRLEPERESITSALLLITTLVLAVSFLMVAGIRIVATILTIFGIVRGVRENIEEPPQIDNFQAV